MKIDGVDITTLFPTKAQFLDYSLPAPSVNRFITVTDLDRKLVNRRVSIGITNIAVRIAMFDTKANCYIMASKLASLLGDSVVDFGDEVMYRVTMSTDGTYEMMTDTLFVYTMQLQVLEKFGDEVTVLPANTSAPIPLTNYGTFRTPIIIELTPTSAGVTQITVVGYKGYHATVPLTISNLTVGQKIILNGEQGVILQDTGSSLVNKFLDTNLVSFPEIDPGVTNITITPSSNVTVSIKFSPRYI